MVSFFRECSVRLSPIRPSYSLGGGSHFSYFFFFLLISGKPIMHRSRMSVIEVLRIVAILFSLVICSADRRNEHNVFVLLMFCQIHPPCGAKHEQTILVHTSQFFNALLLKKKFAMYVRGYIFFFAFVLKAEK